MDMILCVAGIIVWGTQRKECIPTYIHPHHPYVPSHLLAIVILKIMIHAVEIFRHLFKTPTQDSDTTERSVKESIVAILCWEPFFTEQKWDLSKPQRVCDVCVSVKHG